MGRRDERRVRVAEVERAVAGQQVEEAASRRRRSSTRPRRATPPPAAGGSCARCGPRPDRTRCRLRSGSRWWSPSWSRVAPLVDQSWVMDHRRWAAPDCQTIWLLTNSRTSIRVSPGSLVERDGAAVRRDDRVAPGPARGRPRPRGAGPRRRGRTARRRVGRARPRTRARRRAPRSRRPRAVTVTVVPGGVYLRALVSRLVITWCSRCSSPSDLDRLVGQLEAPAVVRVDAPGRRRRPRGAAGSGRRVAARGDGRSRGAPGAGGPPPARSSAADSSSTLASAVALAWASSGWRRASSV